jgi:ABC-type transport system involved in multi-copper enzyme maturation permease subunit
MTSIVSRLPFPRRLPDLRFGSGISAIIVKELRGRMRGRRAFIVITIHVLLLALFAWMFMRLQEETIANLSSFGPQANYASAGIGRGIFLGIMLLQTLIVAVLAPAATAGAISSEREHQTLDLLAVTPISSFAIVLGKLLSALAWVFVLILASIPITALVFVFGGVAPDDLVRGYVVLFATAIGLGSVGIFFSTLTRRTGASTGLTFVATLFFVIGSVFLFIFLGATAEISSTGLRKTPSEALLYLNPFVAQADVACGTEESAFSGTCGIISGIVGTTGDQFPPDQFPTEPVPGRGFDQPADGAVKGGVIVGNGQILVREGDAIRAGPPVVADDLAVAATDPWRDRFWPKSVVSFLILATVMTLLSVQYVTPTRRWRPSLPGSVRRLIRRRSA